MFFTWQYENQFLPHAPDGDAVLVSHIHAVAGLDTVGLLELRKLGENHIDAQMVHGVFVNPEEVFHKCCYIVSASKSENAIFTGQYV